jgi:hypothetical protein
MLDILPLEGFFSPFSRGMEFSFFDGVWVLSCSHSGEHWVSVHCSGQAS